MGSLIAVVGASGVGKTAFVRALAGAVPTAPGTAEGFVTAYEEHAQRPFQALFKRDRRYALANQVDYLLLRAEQERGLRLSPRTGLIDGGLDLDYHGFTRLFHSRGLLTEAEFDLCRRLYLFLRATLPTPELIVRLCADETTVARRLAERDRINIARIEDTSLFNAFLEEWLDSLPRQQVLELDVSNETLEYSRSVQVVLRRVHAGREAA